MPAATSLVLDFVLSLMPPPRGNLPDTRETGALAPATEAARNKAAGDNAGEDASDAGRGREGGGGKGKDTRVPRAGEPPAAAVPSSFQVPAMYADFRHLA